MWIDKEKITTCVLAGGTAGLFASGANIAARYTTDAGDILGFFGGIIGAAGAVFGARWLEDRRRHIDQTTSRTLVRDALVALVMHLDKLTAEKNYEGFISRLLSIMQTCALIKTSTQNFESENSSVSVHLAALAYWLDRDTDKMQDIVESHRNKQALSSASQLSMAKDFVASQVLVYSVLGVDGYWPPASDEGVKDVMGRARIYTMQAIANQTGSLES